MTIRNIALFIDAANVDPESVAGIIKICSYIGEISIRKAFGDFCSPGMTSWADACRTLGIEPILAQSASESNLSGSGIALTIGLTEILNNKRVDIDIYAIAGNLADFSPLCAAIRNKGKKVLGFGASSMSIPYRNTFNKFVTFESIPAILAKAASKNQTAYEPLPEIPAPTNSNVSETVTPEDKAFAAKAEDIGATIEKKSENACDEINNAEDAPASNQDSDTIEKSQSETISDNEASACNDSYLQSDKNIDALNSGKPEEQNNSEAALAQPDETEPSIYDTAENIKQHAQETINPAISVDMPDSEAENRETVSHDEGNSSSENSVLSDAEKKFLNEEFNNKASVSDMRKASRLSKIFGLFKKGKTSKQELSNLDAPPDFGDAYASALEQNSTDQETDEAKPEDLPLYDSGEAIVGEEAAEAEQFSERITDICDSVGQDSVLEINEEKSLQKESSNPVTSIQEPADAGFVTAFAEAKEEQSESDRHDENSAQEIIEAEEPKELAKDSSISDADESEQFLSENTPDIQVPAAEGNDLADIPEAAAELAKKFNFRISKSDISQDEPSLFDTESAVTNDEPTEQLPVSSLILETLEASLEREHNGEMGVNAALNLLAVRGITPDWRSEGFIKWSDYLDALTKTVPGASMEVLGSIIRLKSSNSTIDPAFLENVTAAFASNGIAKMDMASLEGFIRMNDESFTPAKFGSYANFAELLKDAENTWPEYIQTDGDNVYFSPKPSEHSPSDHEFMNAEPSIDISEGDVMNGKDDAPNTPSEEEKALAKFFAENHGLSEQRENEIQHDQEDATLAALEPNEDDTENLASDETELYKELASELRQSQDELPASLEDKVFKQNAETSPRIAEALINEIEEYQPTEDIDPEANLTESADMIDSQETIITQPHEDIYSEEIIAENDEDIDSKAITTEPAEEIDLQETIAKPSEDIYSEEIIAENNEGIDSKAITTEPAEEIDSQETISEPAADIYSEEIIAENDEDITDQCVDNLEHNTSLNDSQEENNGDGDSQEKSASDITLTKNQFTEETDEELITKSADPKPETSRGEAPEESSPYGEFEPIYEEHSDAQEPFIIQPSAAKRFDAKEFELADADDANFALKDSSGQETMTITSEEDDDEDLQPHPESISLSDAEPVVAPKNEQLPMPGSLEQAASMIDECFEQEGKNSLMMKKLLNSLNRNHPELGSAEWKDDTLAILIERLNDPVKRYRIVAGCVTKV